MYENYGWKFTLTAIITALWGLALWFNPIPRGLDLSGGSEIIYTLDFGGRLPSVAATEDAVKVLRERIDKLGIKELTIRRQGNYEIVVQIPSATETEVERIKDQIERAGRLQFMLLAEPGSNGLSAMDIQSETQRILEQKANSSWQENDRYDVAFWHQDARGAAGNAETPALVENTTPSGRRLFVDGSLLADARRSMDEHGKAAVGFEWNSEGAKLFRDLTSPNKGRRLAVVLDGKIRSAPEIQEEIGKSGIINGGPQGWDEKELNALIIILKAGALPAKPVFAYRKHVGAQLGEAAEAMGGIATIISLGIIMVFLCWYYGLRAGMIANLAMLLNVFLLMATLALFGATLTLPGIAGILLTGAMGVDANILIYERIREELARGAALRQAIQAGYDRAFWTIFDAHVTTILTAMILMQVGTGPIRGFGLTLTIGIAVSMYTALLVTQAMYGILIVKGFITELHFKQLFGKINLDYWKAWPTALKISLSIICIGWLVFLARGDEKYGIDFTGGTAIQMLLKGPITKGELTQRIERHFADKKLQIQVEVQQVGSSEGGPDSGREWLLRTRLVAGAPVQQTSSLGGALDLLTSPAWGQGTPSDGAPPGSQTPPGQDPTKAPEADPAPAASQTPTAPTPAPTPVATPNVAESQAADAAAAEAGKKSQEFFEREIRALFKEQLVDPYPSLEAGKEFASTPVEGGKVKARVRVDLIGLPEGFATDAKPVTVERIQAELPRAFRGMAAQLKDDEASRPTKEAYLLLAGPEAGPPGFTVAAANGMFDFELAPVEQGRVERVVSLFKTGLERARDVQVFMSPAMPFPNIDQIGAVVAQNLKSKAFLATILSIIMICLYIWLRFDFWAGVTAVVALAHDVFALLGFMAIIDTIVSAAGVNFDCKFNLTSITAFLTLIGFSINDTIVILDRIREEMRNGKMKEYTPEVVNESINKTLSRTVLTSTTVFMVTGILFIASCFGLTAIQGFSVALLFGVVTGTYSSIFVAAPLLLNDRGKTYRWLGGLGLFFLVTAILNHLR
jgi:SecD/SecF fusion protein